MVVGGDFNATTCPRYGYSGLPHIRVADERLIEWSARSRLTCAAPGPSEAMWLSMDESRQTVRVLDCFFFLRSKGGLPCPEDPVALEAADSRLDHRVVQATLTVEGINSILPLEALMRPVRLNMPVRWWREKAEDWRMQSRPPQGSWREKTASSSWTASKPSHTARPKLLLECEGKDEVVHTLPLITLHTATSPAAAVQGG